MPVLVAALVVATLTHPASWFQRTYDHRGITAVRGLLAGHPAATVFADVRFPDWMLWEDPQLAGRVAYDIRFELLRAHDLEAFTAFYHGRLQPYAATLDPYSALVLDPKNTAETRALLSVPGVRVVLRTKQIIVAAKPAV